MKSMDISSNSGQKPANALSNFTQRKFLFKGVRCNSIEGVLQALKFKDAALQVQICQLVGKEAKRAGANMNWQSTQTLWWQCREIDRHGHEYQEFLDELYETVFEQDASFKETLLATGNMKLTHIIGISDPRKTVLTEHEFCSRLMNLRAVLRRRFRLEVGVET